MSAVAYAQTQRSAECAPYLLLIWCLLLAVPCPALEFAKDVQPILSTYCYDCHGDGEKKGGIAFDELKEPADPANHELWLKVLKNTRAGLMPPLKKSRPTAEEQTALEQWIKYRAFNIDPKSPEPGRVTIRRLNRVEYRNTIRDLLGIDFHTEYEFPPDDTGYGFDNIGDVLSLSPLLLEKYMEAARTIIGVAFPEGTGKPSGKSSHDGNDRAAVRSERAATFAVSDWQSKLAAPPTQAAAKRALAREIITNFTFLAFRHPVDEATVDRLVKIAEVTWNKKGATYSSGVKQALVAVLASPRFLFRLENEAAAASQTSIDEFSLASRLSYFLWSSMPDRELFTLAGKGRLRGKLREQVQRMIKDPRSDEFVRNFTGQWLQVRDAEGTSVNERAILVRDRGGEKELQKLREQLHALKEKLAGETNAASQAALDKLRAQYKALVNVEFDLDSDLRKAMQKETHYAFRHVLQENRPVTELIDCDYTFLNNKLAEFYGLTNLGADGKEFKRVQLPAGSVRGGVLTEASVLLVTSNPDRTSPVKRGLFVLDNVLNTPTPPPPPNIPPLERAENTFHGKDPTLRQALQVHRENPQCASCHSRMDPIGLAFENFNAMGMWREKERGQEIEAAGQLVTGEKFESVQELKHILATSRKVDFYRCLTEKMLTYALGRGLEYYDVEAVDKIVEQLKGDEGKIMTLVSGITESVSFTRQTSAEIGAKSKLASSH